MRASIKNRLTVGGSLALLMILSAVLGSIAKEPEYDVRNRTSTFFTDETGARALYFVMQRLLSSVEQWRQPLQMLPNPEGDSAPNTLVVAGPSLPLGLGEADRLETWIKEGGQLVLLSRHGWRLSQKKKQNRTVTPVEGETISGEDETADGDGSFLQRFGLRLMTRDLDEPLVQDADVPTRFGGEVAVSVSRAAEWLGDYQVMAGSEADPIAVSVSHGEGRIVALGDPRFVSNQRLGESDNAVWLVTLCADWGNGRVAIDEYHHGFSQKRGSFELTLAFLGTPWGWATAQLFLAGLLYAVLFRKRMGRVSDPPAGKPRSPMQLLEARAGLLQSAEAQRLAADLICQQLSVQLDPLRRMSSDWQKSLKKMRAQHSDERTVDLLDRLEGHYQSIANPSTPSKGESELFMLARIAGQLQHQHQHDSRRTKRQADARSNSRTEYARAN